MPLSSVMFSSNSRLQACLAHDESHVTQGDSGPHVALIQAALLILDGADLVADGKFGPITAAAVLKYKTRHQIINHAYQKAPDAIVGKMTIEHLDNSMRALEAPFKILPGATAMFSGLFFAPKIEVKPTRLVIVTETNPPWFNWAKQVKKHFDSLPDSKGFVQVVPIGNGVDVRGAASLLASAATMAGPLGLIVLSVGHGSPGPSPDTGAFDLAPQHRFRLGGRSAWLVGQKEPPDIKKTDSSERPIPCQTSAFYADQPPSGSSSIKIKSELENDIASGSPAARVRIDNFRQYEKVMAAFKPLGLIVLLTCRVGGSSGFLQRVRQQFGTPLLAYKRKVAGQEQKSGRTRIFLEGDGPGVGTNVPTGEFLVPVSIKDMSLII